MTPPLHDAIIIGGGPAGAAAGTFLAKAGKRVLLLEKEIFPRFHIGESLLPYNRAIFEEMGVLPALEKAGFPKKTGAQFHLGNGSKSLFFVFRQGQFTRFTEAFQVERARFDHILLKHARTTGVDAREGWTVTRFSSAPNLVSIEAKDPQNQLHTFQAPFLIDASGRGNLTGNQEKLRVLHPRLKKIAIFGHFKNVRLDPGETGGDTIIVRLENKWFWLIPISTEKVSIGCVLDQSEFTAERGSPADIFEKIWRSSPPLLERMAQAELLGAIQTTSDFSYYNQRFTGPRLLRAGDAAGFMDPIFSGGVYLAMFSGKLAAETVIDSLHSGGDGAPKLAAYEKRISRAMNCYWEMVEHFYTKPFLDLFFNPREKWRIASAVNAFLAGELEQSWRLRWRMRLFFWVVKLQSRRPFTPPVTFDSPTPPTCREAGTPPREA
jgi:flavin-dependent dehydrogenase